MDERPVLPVKLLLIADALAIAVAVILIDISVGFGGISILPLITIPTFVLLCSFGLWMWANGAGANLVSSPGWNSLSEDSKPYAVSVMGLHIAIGMAFVDCAIPFVIIPVWGIAAFIALLLTGMAVTFSGLIRVLTMNRSNPKRFIRKTPLTVWVTVFLVLFTVVAVPVLALEKSGPAGVNIELGETDMTVKAPMVDRTVAYDDIDTVELDPDFSIGSRISGYGGLEINSGKFRNSEYGQYTLASYSTCDTFVKITKKSGEHIVFNQKNAEDTEALYSDLLSRL